MTRRDRLHVIGKRMHQLNAVQSALAWQVLAESLVTMGELELPKFKHLVSAIRSANIKVKHATT